MTVFGRILLIWFGLEVVSHGKLQARLLLPLIVNLCIDNIVSVFTYLRNISESVMLFDIGT